jgi:MgtC family protein
MSEFSLTLRARALLAAALGFVLGWEREARGSAAGDRTYALVGLGSSLVTAVGATPLPGLGREGDRRGGDRDRLPWRRPHRPREYGQRARVDEYLVGTALAGAVFVIFGWQRLPLLSRIGHQKKSSRHER